MRLHDSLTRELRDFVPVTPGRVGIYICGLTTQAPPHIGHIRFAVAFDVLRRWLERGHGYQVDLIRNVTDIDDKILAKSAESGEPWYAVSYRNEVETAEALRALGVLPPTYEPRATGHVTGRRLVGVALGGRRLGRIGHGRHLDGSRRRAGCAGRGRR